MNHNDIGLEWWILAQFAWWGLSAFYIRQVLKLPITAEPMWVEDRDPVATPIRSHRVESTLAFSP